MKVVAAILALAVFSGCHGWSFHQDQPKEPWEDAVDRFWQYVADVNSRAEEMKKTLQSSEINQEFDNLISNTMSELSMYRDDLHNKLGPLAKNTAELLQQDFLLLADKLEADMKDAKERTVMYTTELQTLVEQNTAEVRNRLNTYTRKLKKRLGKDTEEFRNKMSVYFGELQSRINDRVDDVKLRVNPYLTEMHEQTKEKLSALGQMLKSHTEEMRENLETKANDLRQKLEKTQENLRTTLEGKAEEFHAWLEPYRRSVQEAFQIPTEIKNED
ncbi:apolipoprotein Ea [Denticeps clupeoides]|uniref:apolipoprotein Ea n=1 Tax=Denticeps clupeoides TaxID=299321 RepID=UPI0010A32A47|nr:apolipoprotein Eb-like [Denticeps clupeoides]